MDGVTYIISNNNNNKKKKKPGGGDNINTKNNQIKPMILSRISCVTLKETPPPLLALAHTVPSTTIPPGQTGIMEEHPV